MRIRNAEILLQIECILVSFPLLGFSLYLGRNRIQYLKGSSHEGAILSSRQEPTEKIR